MPNSCPIDKAETTNKIIFISFNGNVDTNQFSFVLGASLFNTERFAIARETRDKRRVE